MPDPDRVAPERLRARQRRRLSIYLTEEVHPFSTTEAARLDACGLGARGVRDLADLARLPPVSVDALDGIASVLRPTAASLAGSPLRWQWRWARLTGRRGRFVDERIEPAYRAIHFDDHDGLVVASSAADLDRLADLGRRWLEQVGVREDDAVVGVLPARGDLAFWQLTLGCRRGGVPALHLGDMATSAEVAAYAPSVLVGAVDALRRVGALAAPVDGVRLLLVAGAEPLLPADRLDLGARFPGAVVRAAWAPPGVRALWSECEAGELHTWPDTELVEVLDPAGRPAAPGVAGELVWTPIGWRGTVVLRIRTGIDADLLTEACPGCRRTSPRIETEPGRTVPSRPTAPRDEVELALAAVLDDEVLVADWVAAHRPSGAGRDVLVVHLAPVGGGRAALEAELPRLGGELRADRVVVERPSLVAARRSQAGGRRFLDRELH